MFDYTISYAYMHVSQVYSGIYIYIYTHLVVTSINGWEWRPASTAHFSRVPRHCSFQDSHKRLILDRTNVPCQLRILDSCPVGLLPGQMIFEQVEFLEGFKQHPEGIEVTVLTPPF